MRIHSLSLSGERKKKRERERVRATERSVNSRILQEQKEVTYFYLQYLCRFRMTLFMLSEQTFFGGVKVRMLGSKTT